MTPGFPQLVNNAVDEHVAEMDSFWLLVGSKETSTSLLTKLVPGQMGLSQQLNSKAACLIVRPAVGAATKSVSSGCQSCQQEC